MFQAVASCKHSQLHSFSIELGVFFTKNKKRQQSFLPAFQPCNVSAAAIPQMAGREGQEGQLFNPLQRKHDLSEPETQAKTFLRGPTSQNNSGQLWHCVCPLRENLWDVRAVDQLKLDQRLKYYFSECACRTLKFILLTRHIMTSWPPCLNYSAFTTTVIWDLFREMLIYYSYSE